MQAIKSYQLQTEHPITSFEIKTMEEVYQKNEGKIDKPHRHEYYTILIVKRAKGVHKIDFKDYHLAPLQVFFLSPGQVHQLIEHEQSYGWIITFAGDFLVEYGVKECFFSDINLFRAVGDTEPLAISRDLYDTLEGFCKHMQFCFDQKSKFSYEAASAYLKLLLIECNDVCVLPSGQEQANNAGFELLRKFKLLVKGNFRKNHKVGDYASQLHITADYLNKVVKQTIGITAKEYIIETLLLEIKRLLFYTNMASKEIAYELGFTDPAYFSSFFKKQTGKSLSNFKKGLR